MGSNHGCSHAHPTAVALWPFAGRDPGAGVPLLTAIWGCSDFLDQVLAAPE